MPSLDYPLIDCDNHYYETDDCFSRHIESSLRERTVWVDRTQREDGFGTMMLGDDRLAFFSVGVGDYVGAPGIMKSFFKGQTEEGGAVNANAIRALEEPRFTHKPARLELMDAQGLLAFLMLPTLGCGVEYQLRQRRHDDIRWPSIRSFNRWVAEEWGWGADRRIYATAMISLIELEPALVELERVLAEGCKLLHLNTGPIDGRSPADPAFDPFWARVQEAGVTIVYHIGSGPFNELYASPWGEPANPPSHRHTAMNMYLGMGERTIVDQIAATIFHNLFGRFPGLQFMIVEFGAAWLPRLVKTLDKIYRMGDHKSRWPWGKPDTPSEVFRRHFHIVPFYEDDFQALAAAVGVECLLNGSDFPHPEGLAEPVEMVEELSGFNAADVRRIMRSNGASILGLAA